MEKPKAKPETPIKLDKYQALDKRIIAAKDPIKKGVLVSSHAKNPRKNKIINASAKRPIEKYPKV